MEDTAPVPSRRRLALACTTLALALAAGCGFSGGAAPLPLQASGGPFVADGPATHAVVWAVGDGPPGPGAAATARLVSGARADTVLYLGDVYPNGTASAFKNAYRPTYGVFASRTAPTPGNHDWPYRTQGYEPYWRSVHGRRTPAWYSFRAGGWRLISLNSEAASSPAQLGWLRTQLRGSGTCSLAFWHRPRFSAGLHGDAADMDPYWRTLAGHARIVVSGHDHDMQRMSPRNGLVQYVSGAGGHSHYAIDRSYAGLAFGNDSEYGALRITLRPGSASLDFVSASGRTLDSSRAICRR